MLAPDLHTRTNRLTGAEVLQAEGAAEEPCHRRGSRDQSRHGNAALLLSRRSENDNPVGAGFGLLSLPGPGRASGPTESQGQGGLRGQAGGCFVGTAPVPWLSPPLHLLI